MGFLASLCLCLPDQQKRNQQPSETTQNPLQHASNYGNRHREDDVTVDQYWPACPLPRYTERPISVYEKTIVFGRDDGPRRGNSRDEKRQQHFTNDDDTQTEEGQGDHPTRNSTEDHSSDVSSTYSVPSSYGNTSTATRVTPPPPYSSNTSRAPSQRTRSVSLTRTELEVALGTTHLDQFSPTVPPLQQPQPVMYRRTDQWAAWNTEPAHRSWESGRTEPPLPPYSGT